MVFDIPVRLELKEHNYERYAAVLTAFKTGDLSHVHPPPTQEVKAIFETQCWVLGSYSSPEFPPEKRASIEVTPPTFQQTQSSVQAASGSTYEQLPHLEDGTYGN